MAMVKYLRQSMGKQASISQQDEVGDDRAAELDQVVYATFRDYTSAGPYAKKRREEWDAMLAVLAQPAVTHMWLWEPSRGSRELEDWAHFLNRCKKHDVGIYVETHEQVYDMLNARHWKTMAEEGINSQYFSEETSKRIKRNVKAGIKDGRPHGRTAYGWKRIYGEVDGQPKLLRQAADETEAPVVRELFARHDQGESVCSIQRDFAARGIRSRERKHRRTGQPYGGKPFSVQQLRQMLLNPGYAGIRTHSSQGRSDGRGTLSAGVTVHDTDPEVWEPLVSQELYYRVEAALTARGRTGRPGRGVHLCSWLVLCGTCGGHLGTRRHHGKWAYFCQEGGGCVTCQEPALDSAVEEKVLSYLAGIGFAAEREDRKAGAPDARLAAIRGELEAKRAKQRAIGAKLAAGEISLEMGIQADSDLKAQIAELEVQQREISGMTRLDAIMGDPAEKVDARWRVMPLSARRKVLRILFTPEHMGQPYLMHEPPGVKPGSVPVADRLAWGEPAAEVREDPAPEGFRRCTKCREVLPLDAEHFYRSRETRNGFEGSCKKCRLERRRDRNVAPSA